MIRHVVILGAGSAGLLAALSLKARLPQLTVRIVCSREIGIIGVGEGSTADLPNHLHGFLGIDPRDFHAGAAAGALSQRGLRAELGGECGGAGQ